MLELRFLTPETYPALTFVHPVAQKHPQNKLNTSFDHYNPNIQFHNLSLE